MIAAFLAFLGGRGVAIIAGAAGAIALLVGVYQTGVSAERKRGEAASLRAQLAIVRADLDIARKAEADALTRAAALAVESGKNKDVIDELETDLLRRPAVGRCALDRADRQRLLNIR